MIRLKKLIRTGAYVRVSHDEQKKHGYSVAAQKAGLQEYANKNGYIIVEWYIDEAKSARKKSAKRKELMRLVEDAKQGKFKMIIFKCIDRWFRNISEYYKIQDVLDENGVNWECSEEDYDTTTRDGRFKLHLYLMLAQDEADKGSERIIYVFDDKIKNGEAIYGSASLPLGLVVKEIDGKKRVVIDEETEHIVRDIFDLYETVRSKGKVQQMINDKYDVDISYKNITTLLKSPMCYGMYKGNPNYVYGRHYMSAERWHRIQDIIKSNVYTTSTKRDYLYSRMIKCHKCNHTMSGQTSERNGSKWIYYRCNNKYVNKKCDTGFNLEEKRVEAALIRQIKPQLEKYIANYNLQSITPKPKVNVAKLRKEHDRLNIQFRKGRISEAEYDAEYQAIEDKITSADAAKPKPKDLSYLKDILESNIETVYATLTREEKAMFWRSFVKRIVLDKEYNVVHLDVL